MIQSFIADIGPAQFLKQANNTKAVIEIAKFYDITLLSEADITRLFDAFKHNQFHQEAFVYAIYFAAWIKSEVHDSKRAFKLYDEELLSLVEGGGSIQSMLINLVRNTIHWDEFRQPFKTNINGVKKFLDSKGVQSQNDFNKLDDIEARHLMDQVIMYSGLEQMRLHEVQTRLGLEPSTTD